jgi:membrane associated rhomboid family serine protease
VTVYFFFVLPVRMSMSAVALVTCGLEVVMIIFNWLPDVAHSAHLGGAVFGAFYTWLMLPRNRYA